MKWDFHIADMASRAADPTQIPHQFSGQLEADSRVVAHAEVLRLWTSRYGRPEDALRLEVSIAPSLRQA